MTGATTGSVRLLLRAEGLCVLAASLVCYAKFGAGWGVFAATFLLPDLSLAAYLAGARVGAIAYNAAHAYLGPLASLVAALVFPGDVPVALGIVWCAHIGFDRALGYGLKYQRGFGFTHLGAIGRTAPEAAASLAQQTSSGTRAPPPPDAPIER